MLDPRDSARSMVMVLVMVDTAAAVDLDTSSERSSFRRSQRGLGSRHRYDVSSEGRREDTKAAKQSVGLLLLNCLGL